MSAPRFTRLVRDWHEEECGQVTILFVFASIGFVIMLGFILSTAQQTSRKIQMQDAADATAVVGATWVARGMNLIAFDNKGMADVVGVMIDVHAVRQAAEAMQVAIPIAAGALEAMIFCPPCVALGVKMDTELFSFWEPFFIPMARTVDETLSGDSGTGWVLLGALDDLNRLIATSTPPLAVLDAAYYGHANGLPNAVGLFPYAQLPIERGGKERLAIQADNCCLSTLKWTTLGVVSAICIVPATASCFLFAPLFLVAVPMNVSSLQGGASISQYFQYDQSDLENPQLQGALDQYNQTLQNGQGAAKNAPIDLGTVAGKMRGMNIGIAPLQWPDSPPEPMILTDTGNPGDTVDGTPPAIDLLVVRNRLQYLAGTWAPSVRNGVLAGAKLVNPAPYGWLTYGQADVYNPHLWDMFDQHWRARLARASNLTQDWTKLTGGLGLGVSGIFDSSFVNTH